MNDDLESHRKGENDCRECRAPTSEMDLNTDCPDKRRKLVGVR